MEGGGDGGFRYIFDGNDRVTECCLEGVSCQQGETGVLSSL